MNSENIIKKVKTVTSPDIAQLVTTTNCLYEYDLYDDKVTEYKILKVTQKKIHISPSRWGNKTIYKEAVGDVLFITKREAILNSLKESYAEKWASLVNDLKWSDKIIEKMEKLNINWRHPF